MTHENFDAPLPAHELSDRTFGLVMGGVLTLVGLLPLRHGGAVRLWALVPAALLLLAAAAMPRRLRPVKQLWMRFGRVMNRVVAHAVAALLLVAVFAPMRLLLALAGKDLLALKWDPAAKSYWTPRESPAPGPETMANQF